MYEAFGLGEQKRFFEISQPYVRVANAILIVYDVGSYDSFQEVPHFLQTAKTNARSDAIFALIGNCVDRSDILVATATGQVRLYAFSL